MPILKARTLALVAAAALTDARLGVRHALAPDGPLARAAGGLVQAGLNAYLVLSVVAWALLLCVTAPRSGAGAGATKDIFG
jgi:hypothetical protein